ncbi:hypothetical protein Poli38472_014435 [Pythium oligandrum]|uniref:tRNA pseudouridine synthase n=1 Tax=Pythium oligandrum TaxID=41045 RepID=A0A8K1C786_PYTOL|nr:hypothetical protein Poli38472_014435 [Pythium oligandrum]|eukprot:TMW57832.1 hypothetical protein Poli38472_014435 [Pythium oligandrum]
MTMDAPLSRSERKRQHQAALQQQNTQMSGKAASSGENKVASIAKKLKKGSFLPLAEDQSFWRKCVVEYDGSAFSGFQAQEQAGKMRTVQETIEDAILRTTGETVRVRGASRTDKGVHARGQVIAFSSRCTADDKSFRDALNTRLPEDVVCHSMTQVDGTEGFDPRANSIGKIYEYRIVYGAIRPVLGRHHVWFMKKTLDTTKMRAAIEFLVAPPAAKDFSAFTPPKSSQLNDEGGKGNVCTLFSAELVDETADQEAESRQICMRFHGDRFLYKMVRNLVGTLVDVGLGKLEPETIPVIFETKDRSKAGQGAPPHGLTLVRVMYNS